MTRSFSHPLRMAAITSIAFCALVLGALSAQAAEDEMPGEMLSAQVNRLEMMMKDCTDKRKAGMSIEQCSCFFEEAVDRDISNVDVGYYVGGRSEWENISSNSVKMDMAGLQIECLGASTTAFYNRTVADYREKLDEHERLRNEARKAPPLEPLATPANYSMSTREGSAEDCGIIYWRDAPFCGCILEESQRYYSEPQFQQLFSRVATTFDMLSDAQVLHFEKIRGQCEADYTGQMWTTDMRDEAISNRGPRPRTHKGIGE